MKKKVEKDLGIPNEWPFKEQELKALEDRRARALEEFEQKKVAKKDRGWLAEGTQAVWVGLKFEFGKDDSSAQRKRKRNWVLACLSLDHCGYRWTPECWAEQFEEITCCLSMLRLMHASIALRNCKRIEKLDDQRPAADGGDGGGAGREDGEAATAARGDCEAGRRAAAGEGGGAVGVVEVAGGGGGVGADGETAGGDCGGKAWVLGAVAGAAVAAAAVGAGFAFRSETLVYGSNLLPVMEFPKHEESREKSLLRFSNVNTRRLMIGSRVPLCTYNECRGCRFKCSAEQVPVDESDPINSAYRYRCRCHA
ncbi:hypothetical protein ZIOFF_012377 [Zingiber officinale]|uniref:Uncharacterized protein n=1 Tax=Zingiber officinale TaxID=94328 RepID=A0A8J5I9R3_ZINOF|nr:hypothetical protein ZIOFF_012377 [Zingiber officinale]